MSDEPDVQKEINELARKCNGCSHACETMLKRFEQRVAKCDKRWERLRKMEIDYASHVTWGQESKVQTVETLEGIMKRAEKQGIALDELIKVKDKLKGGWVFAAIVCGILLGLSSITGTVLAIVQIVGG
jgi:uncharacterized protein YukE